MNKIWERDWMMILHVFTSHLVDADSDHDRLLFRLEDRLKLPRSRCFGMLSGTTLK